MFSFLGNCQTVFHSDWTILHSHQQCMWVPISPYPCQYLIFFIKKTIAIPVGMKRYLIVFFICIFLITTDVKRFLCAYCHFYVFFEETTQVLFTFFTWVVCLYMLLNCRRSLYILDIKPLSDVWFSNAFSHSVGCLFTF